MTMLPTSLGRPKNYQQHTNFVIILTAPSIEDNGIATLSSNSKHIILYFLTLSIGPIETNIVYYRIFGLLSQKKTLATTSLNQPQKLSFWVKVFGKQRLK